MTYEALVARVKARLAGVIVGDGGDREEREIISTTLDELGFRIDEATGDVMAKPAAAASTVPEDNWRNSVRVPTRRRR